jgi:hypothetical protein
MEANLYLEFHTNLFGNLSDDIKDRILSYLERPTYVGWNDIHGIIIVGKFQTIWQTILMVDSTFPKTGRTINELGKVVKDWDRIPDKKLLIKALKYAAEQNTGISFN